MDLAVLKRYEEKRWWKSERRRCPGLYIQPLELGDLDIDVISKSFFDFDAHCHMSSSASPSSKRSQSFPLYIFIVLTLQTPLKLQLEDFQTSLGILSPGARAWNGKGTCSGGENVLAASRQAKRLPHAGNSIAILRPNALTDANMLSTPASSHTPCMWTVKFLIV